MLIIWTLYPKNSWVHLNCSQTNKLSFLHRSWTTNTVLTLFPEQRKQSGLCAITPVQPSFNITSTIELLSVLSLAGVSSLREGRLCEFPSRSESPIKWPEFPMLGLYQLPWAAGFETVWNFLLLTSQYKIGAAGKISVFLQDTWVCPQQCYVLLKVWRHYNYEVFSGPSHV